jgi:hypothetical protein
MDNKQKTSKHLDNDKSMTKAAGEKKSGVMDGIVGGLPKRVSPVVVDGIVRGIPRRAVSSGHAADVSKVMASATPHNKGMFGSGAFPEGHM